MQEPCPPQAAEAMNLSAAPAKSSAAALERQAHGLINCVRFFGTWGGGNTKLEEDMCVLLQA